MVLQRGELHSLLSVLVLLGEELESRCPSGSLSLAGSEPSDLHLRSSDLWWGNEAFFGETESSDFEASAVIPGVSPFCLVQCFPLLAGTQLCFLGASEAFWTTLNDDSSVFCLCLVWRGFLRGDLGIFFR